MIFFSSEAGHGAARTLHARHLLRRHQHFLCVGDISASNISCSAPVSTGVALSAGVQFLKLRFIGDIFCDKLMVGLLEIFLIG